MLYVLLLPVLVSLLIVHFMQYFAKATASGPGRRGTVRSNGDAPIQLAMDQPKVAGGRGEGHTPEQLFAMGYSCEFIGATFSAEVSTHASSKACFLGALQLAASRAGQPELTETAKVNASVFLGHPKDPHIDGFGLRVELTVEGCDDDAVISAAHDVRNPRVIGLHLSDTDNIQFCPYSRALSQGAEVKVMKV